MKKYAYLLMALLLVTALTSSYALTIAQDKTVVEIYFPVAVDSPVTEILNGYAEAYEAEHEDVDIVFTFQGAYGDVRNKLTTTMEGGGDLPAMAIMLATDVYDLRNAELVQPWDPYLGEEDVADFAETWMSNSYYDYDADEEAELYGVPFQRSTVLLYYNADLLAEAGLEAPTNWEELATTAQALTTEERSGILIPNSWPYWVFQPFAAGAGQNIVSDSDVEVFFDSPEVVEALQYWVDLYETYEATPAGVQDNWGAAPGAFTDGTAAMIVHSSGSMTGILDRAEFEVGVSALPGKDGEFFTVTGGGNIYLINGVDEETAQAAADFVKWLTAPERAVDWSINTGYINTRTSGFESEEWAAYTTENPQAAAAAETVDVAVREFSVQELNAVRTILHTYILKVLNGEMSAEEAMSAAQEEANGILEIYQ